MSNIVKANFDQINGWVNSAHEKDLLVVVAMAGFIASFAEVNFLNFIIFRQLAPLESMQRSFVQSAYSERSLLCLVCSYCIFTLNLRISFFYLHSMQNRAEHSGHIITCFNINSQKSKHLPKSPLFFPPPHLRIRPFLD